MKTLKTFLQFILVLYLLFPIQTGQAANNYELTPILKEIETNNRSWIAFEADIQLDFFVSSKPAASCQGTILYQRLDEKILLHCSSNDQKQLFIFQTNDRDFSLYLPAQKSLIVGSIFDLEDSPDISSHLKPRDLYRSLKPERIPVERPVRFFLKEDSLSVLRIPNKNNLSLIERELWVRSPGKIEQELYFNSQGENFLTITRSQYEKQNIQGTNQKASLPYQIIITRSDEDKRSTKLTLKNVKLLNEIPEEKWDVEYPPETQVTKLGYHPWQS